MLCKSACAIPGAVKYGYCNGNPFLTLNCNLLITLNSTPLIVLNRYGLKNVLVAQYCRLAQHRYCNGNPLSTLNCNPLLTLNRYALKNEHGLHTSLSALTHVAFHAKPKKGTTRPISADAQYLQNNLKNEDQSLSAQENLLLDPSRDEENEIILNESLRMEVAGWNEERKIELLRVLFEELSKNHEMTQKSSSEHIGKNVEELIVAEKIFRILDANKDGLLSLREFRSWYGLYGINRYRYGDENAKAESADCIALTSKQKILILFRSSIPYVGFGFMDNSIMLLFGELIDQKLGATLHLSIFAAAGLGNLISCSSAVLTGRVIERYVFRLRWLPNAKLTTKQSSSSTARKYHTAGSVIGICIGCVIGMFPLLFLPSSSHSRGIAA